MSEHASEIVLEKRPKDSCRNCESSLRKIWDHSMQTSVLIVGIFVKPSQRKDGTIGVVLAKV